MKACASCGTGNEANHRNCVGCGCEVVSSPEIAVGLPMVQEETTPQWQPVPGRTNHVTMRIAAKCHHCGALVPLNGPTQVAHCDQCMKESQLGDVAYALTCVSKGYAHSSYQLKQLSNSGPQCSNCDAMVPIAEYSSLVGARTVIPCPDCKYPLPTYPAPAWLKTELPTVLQVFGGDAETSEAEGGVQLNVDTATIEPIAMSCPKCSGGLAIGPEDERTTTCPYCAASVFLPDALWNRLHPTRTMVRWTLTYTGELQTAGELHEAAEKKREVEWQAALDTTLEESTDDLTPNNGRFMYAAFAVVVAITFGIFTYG